MPNTNDHFNEDAALLFPDKRSEKFKRGPETYYETPIVQGVITQLRRWPMDLFYSFLAICMIIGSIIFLISVTVAICLPTVVSNRSRVDDISILKLEASSNVYFFKLENQKWSTSDYCYIETAARRHPDLNIYLIDLLKEELVEEGSKDSVANKTNVESKVNDCRSSSSILTPEKRLQGRLVFGNSNVHRINVSIDKFFKGSELSAIAKHLNDEVLEMAAKAQLLWSVPGVALKPNMYCNLDRLKPFLCNRNKEDCLPTVYSVTAIEPENGIQVTGVPCQAFLAFLLHEISKNSFDKKYTLREAFQKFCPRAYCPEVRILDSIRKCSIDSSDCPIVYSTAVLQDLYPGNFIT